MIKTMNGKSAFPRARFRRRVLRDLILCGVVAKKNPTRWLCDDAARVISMLEVALQDARRSPASTQRKGTDG